MRIVSNARWNGFAKEIVQTWTLDLADSSKYTTDSHSRRCRSAMSVGQRKWLHPIRAPLVRRLSLKAAAVSAATFAAVTSAVAEAIAAVAATAATAAIQSNAHSCMSRLKSGSPTGHNSISAGQLDSAPLQCISYPYWHFDLVLTCSVCHLLAYWFIFKAADISIWSPTLLPFDWANQTAAAGKLCQLMSAGWKPSIGKGITYL